MHPYLRLAAAVVSALVVAACGQGQAGDGERAAPLVDTTPAIPLQVEVEVYGDRLQPPQLVLEAGTPVRVEVINRSPTPCSFFVADFLGELVVPSGGRADMAFTVPNLPGPPGAAHSTTTMGCRGDSSRVGGVVVEPRPA